MTKKGQSESPVGEQGVLIDVAPKNSKRIIATAKRYKQAQTERINALQKEIEEKHNLLTLLKEEDLQKLEGGKISLRVDGFTITVTPRDELIRIKDDSEPDTEE